MISSYVRDGCLSEMELFQAFRRELPAESAQAVLLHVVNCDLCHEQWKRLVVDEQLADGIRAAVRGDVGVADQAPGAAEPAPLPDRINLPGFSFDDDFVEGGQARVYRAVHEASREPVAIKVFFNSLLNEGGKARFFRELRSLARLRHPHVIPIRSEGEVHGHPYIVMPWIDGCSLTDHVERADLTIRQRITVMAKICDALDHAHKRGVMHLDLKPSNVRVDSGGEPVVLDFGLARLIDADAEDAEVAVGVAGTPLYMAPEQIRDRSDVDIRADVYMLGLLLYEVLSGKRAKDTGSGGDSSGSVSLSSALIEPPPIRRLTHRVNRELAAIVDKSVTSYRAARYQSAGALKDDLERYLAHQPVSAMESRPLYVFSKFCRNHFTLVVGVIAIFAAISSMWVVKKNADQMVSQANERLDQVNRQSSHATVRQLAEAYTELAQAYRAAGDQDKADLYQTKAHAALLRLNYANRRNDVTSYDDALILEPPFGPQPE